MTPPPSFSPHRAVAQSPEAAGELLSNAEIRALTDTNVRDAQCEALAEMGIPYIRRAGKKIKVSRELMRQRMLGVELKQPQGPRLDLVK